jgi:predicted dehydrogenase
MLTMVVLGTGSIGSRHLSVIRTLPEAKALAIPVRTQRRVELAQAGYLVCDSLEAAAAQGATRAIIATDTGRHLADAQAALGLGFALLVEKPLASNLAEARELCRCALQAQQPVYVGCTFRFSESLNRFHDLLPQLGRVHSVRIECQSYLPDWRPDRPYGDSYSARADQGGVLRDLIHEIDYAGWLFGWPCNLQARVRNLRRLSIEADESADVLWETQVGAVVSICLDYLSRPARRRMRASGERGTLEWDALTRKVTVALTGEPVQEITSTQERNEMLRAQTEAFLMACAGKSNAQLATLEDGVKALAICDAARRASDGRREERVTYGEHWN